MEQLNISLVVVGAAVLVFGLVSRVLDRSLLSMPLLAFCVGLLLGPVGLNLLEPASWGDQHLILQEAARLTLGISLMGIALRLPPRYILDHRRPIAVLILLILPFMFATSTALAWGLLGVPVVVAMLIGSAICPTDPVVASSVVTGSLAQEKLPERFRHTLSAEAGSNDGLAYPLVLLPILLIMEPDNTWQQWFLQTLLWEVGGALLCGVVLGFAAGHALCWAEKRKYLDQPSFLAITLALTILALGINGLLQTDAILAVFAAGIAFDSQVGGAERSAEDNVQEAVNMFFTLPVFVLFGLMAPIDEWLAWGWPGVAMALLVLLLRRLPFVLVLRRILPDWQDYKTALLGGWFGPIGVSALFYAMLIYERTGKTEAWTAGSLVVAASLFAHGVTAAPSARRYGKAEARER